MKGFSRANLFYMRRVAAAWPNEAVVQQLVGQLPWGQITVLLDRLDDQETRNCYAAQVGKSNALTQRRGPRSLERERCRIRRQSRPGKVAAYALSAAASAASSGTFSSKTLQLPTARRSGRVRRRTAAAGCSSSRRWTRMNCSLLG